MIDFQVYTLLSKQSVELSIQERWYIGKAVMLSTCLFCVECNCQGLSQEALT